MTKIAAVTGATGFVGKHLICELIAQGFQVNALTRRPRPKKEKPEKENINWISGDLDNRLALMELVKNADVVYHLAGLVKAKSKDDFNHVNSHAVKTLVDVIHQSATKPHAKPHFILLSSLAARERKLSAYAESKRKGEEILTEHAGDMSWTILRPPGVYGQEDKETLKIFKAVSYRMSILPGSADNRASWIYAPDLARALIAVTDNQACYGQILDVDDGKKDGYANQEMYETAADILNISVFNVVMPRFILKAFGHINVLFSTLFDYIPMITPEKVNELCHSDWICHGPHVMKLTNWKPETSLKRGFEKTLKWYKDNNLM